MISRGRLLSLLLAAALVMAVVIGVGWAPRMSRRKALAAAVTESNQAPRVTVARVELAPSRSELELPCDLQAMIESPINARVEGYITKRSVDIGMRVRKGDPLVELDTPELDQQIRQAKATIAQFAASLKQSQAKMGESRAGLKLAQLTAERWKKMVAEGVISRQDADEKTAVYEVKVAELEAAEANITAAKEAMTASEANLQRLEELKSFSRLNAPFDGIVTWRNPDVGTLISPGSGGKEMFRVSDISTIRVFVGIPQSHVPYVTKGVPATLTVDDLPGRAFPGQVSNIANALDPNTRTMLAVIKIPNPDGVLKPGMYSKVKFQLPATPNGLRVPGDAVVSSKDGTAVAVVDAQNHVHFRKIIVARDDGSSVEVRSGVARGEMVIIAPSDEIRENAVVEPNTPSGK